MRWERALLARKKKGNTSAGEEDGGRMGMGAGGRTGRERGEGKGARRRGRGCDDGWDALGSDHLTPHRLERGCQIPTLYLESRSRITSGDGFAFGGMPNPRTLLLKEELDGNGDFMTGQPNISAECSLLSSHVKDLGCCFLG